MPTTTLPKLSEMLGLPQCLTDAERGTAIAVYNHRGESAALKSAHNMIGKRLAALEAQNAELREALRSLAECPDYRGIQTHEMITARALLGEK
jgi:hypothetical protein